MRWIAGGRISSARSLTVLGAVLLGCGGRGCGEGKFWECFLIPGNERVEISAATQEAAVKRCKDNYDKQCSCNATPLPSAGMTEP